MPWRDFRNNLRSIALLALGLVVFTVLGVGFTGHWLFGRLPLVSVFILGAIVAPTDPLAAVAIAQRLRVPRRIQRILEGEGLVNDSTGLVTYRIAVAAAMTGSFSIGNAGLEFLKMAGGGIGFGLIIGWVATQIQRRIDDPPIEITISLLTPFAAALPADKLGLSGILAVVSAGMYVGWRSPLIHNANVRLQSVPVWEMIQFLLNGLVFLLIGLELPQIMTRTTGASAAALALEAVWISAAVILIRMIWVFSAAYLPRLFARRSSDNDPLPGWRHVGLVAWTGMRGAVSLAAALGLPHTAKDGRPFPARDTIQFLTYALILATLVVQGSTLPRVIRWLGVRSTHEAEEEELDARLKAKRAVLARLDELADKEPEDAIERLRTEYNDRIRELESSKQAEEQESPGGGSAFRRLQQEALTIERRTILNLRNEHIINDEEMRRIQHELDLAERGRRLRPD